jgi:hypothetical protein
VLLPQCHACDTRFTFDSQGGGLAVNGSAPLSAVRSNASLPGPFSPPEHVEKAKGVRRPLPSRKSSATSANSVGDRSSFGTTTKMTSKYANY